MTTQQVAIVGAGVAGVRVAQALRKHGHTGAVVLLGSEPHLPYDKPPLSKKLITGEAQLHEIHLADDQALADLAVDYRPGNAATGLDPEAPFLRLADGSELEFERLVIASGSTPRQLPGTAGIRNVFTLRTIEDSLGIQDAAKGCARACVVGGGVLGAEVAASLRAHGLDVTIVELAPGLLHRALHDSAVATALSDLHVAAGVHLRLGIGVRELVAADGSVAGVALTDGSTVSADLVVIALGVRADTDWLDGSGLEVQDGLICDEFLRTSRANIWGAGDVVRVQDPGRGTSERAEHWTSATEQANVVALNLLSGPDDQVAFRPAPYVWSDQHGERIQIIGTTAGAEVEEVLRKPDSDRLLSLFGAGGRFLGAAAIGLPRPIARLRPLLAAEGDFDAALELARSLV